MELDRQRLLGIGIIAGVLLLAFGSGSLSTDIVTNTLLIMPAIVLHEVSHGFVANLRGDDTAKRAGRLTLNPIKHIDLFGTILMPALLTMSGMPAFGYAKPVPVNVSRLRNQRVDSFIVGFAGPITNLLLSAFTVILVRLAFTAQWSDDITKYIIQFGVLNISLAIFNLLPIPPLDGSSIFELILPANMRENYYRFRQYAMIGLIVMLLVFNDQLQRILFAIEKPFLRAYADALPPELLFRIFG